MKSQFKLFVTAFLQVFFVAVNTVFISRQMFFGVFLAGFVISFLWTLNVARTACASWIDRVVYALGAACGSVSGAMLAYHVMDVTLCIK